MSLLEPAATHGTSYQELKSIDSKVDELQSDVIDMLLGFYDRRRSCFALTPGRSRYSITSTCCSLLAVDAARVRWRDQLNVQKVVDALLVEDWRGDDLYQTTLTVSTLLLLDPQCAALRRHPEQRAKFAEAVGSILDARPSRQQRNAPTSAYMRYWAARALMLLSDEQRLVSAAIPAEALPDGAREHADADLLLPRLTLALQRAAEAAYDDVCRQLAFWLAKDMSCFDVVSLAYALVTYATVGDAMARASVAPRADGSRDAVGTSSALPPANQRLVSAAMATLFEAMNEIGTWDKGMPIFLSRGKGNDVGNAFVFAPDMLATLLESLPADAFRPHMWAVARHVAWLQQNQVYELMSPEPQLDGEAADELGAPPTELRGWRSDHLPPGGPLAWSTAQAVRCLARVHVLTRALINADVLASLGGRGSARPAAAAWDRLLDSDLVSHGTTLKQVLDQRMLTPLAALAAADPGGTESYSALLAATSYSGILFGPPGTAKSTVVEAIARRLGWGFVTIDTSAFLAGGLGNVAARITEVFALLMELENVVVLFDEVEEFCLDRSNAQLGMESRMLTTAMLTKIADLRGRRKVAFFIATNRLAALDAAVTRPGRFDLQLFVGTPNLPARMSRFRARLAAALEKPGGGAAGDGELLAAAFEAVLRRHWVESARYMTFLETEKLAADSLALRFRGSWEGGPPAEQPELEEQIEQLLTAQAAVMTVRGTVRDDFDQNMNMSRF